MVIFSGFVAVVKSNFCAAVPFLMIMILVVISQIIASIASLSINAEISRTWESNLEVKNKMRQSLEMYGTPSSSDHTEAWNHIQSKLRCCGLIDANDYLDTEFFNITKQLPNSCCSDVSDSDYLLFNDNFYDCRYRFFTWSCRDIYSSKMLGRKGGW